MLDLPHECGPNWQKLVIDQLRTLDNRHVLSARSQLVHWTRVQLAKMTCAEQSQWSLAHFEVMDALVARMPYVLNGQDSLEPLYPFPSMDSLLCEWISLGARVDSRKLFPFLVPSGRCSHIYERLLETGPNASRSADPETSLLVMAVKAGNVALVDLVLGRAPQSIVNHCLELVYSMHVADPFGLLECFARHGRLENVCVTFSLRDSFWQRHDDGWKARWLEALYLRGVTSMMPTKYAEIESCAQRVLDSLDLYRRNVLLLLME